MSDRYSDLQDEVTQLHADICSALADPRRILLIYALHERPRYVTELSELLNISQSSTSRHLKVLRDRGLVQTAREGTAVLYSLADSRLVDALDTLRAVLRDRIHYRASLLAEPETVEIDEA